MVKVVAIAGSPSHPSRTYGVLEYTLKLLQQEGWQTEILSVRDFPAEDLVYGRYESPSLEPAKVLIDKADVIVIATPIYKASYTGVLKAFLDLLPQKALAGKVIFPIATGGTLAHLLAVEYALKPVLFELGGRDFVSTVYIVDKHIQKQSDDSVLLDDESEQRLRQVISELIATVNNSPVISPVLPQAS
ncbi:NADPH-dependent FMN reductase [Gloeothece verrucosa]|uniref:FMN reductase n=1 Tax=Gloeothece verrucosa (strain PCC 7822) TaxID=497965 RepID=E0UEY8_GLOV7|nr:NADPH-dependent FMN reductase [Gloeothece verrucosa]ADN13118.1 FMN reductase [Gloeothece verrucosa PCC 7822]